MCAFFKEIVGHNLILGSDKICIHTVITDNERATAIAADLNTNFVGWRDVLFITFLSLSMTHSKLHQFGRNMEIVNQTTKYLNHRTKAKKLLRKEQLASGVTHVRIQTVKHDIPTRWHSRICSMLTFLTRYNDILSLAEEMSVPSSQIPKLSVDHKNTMAEFIVVLGEVRRVYRQLEAHRKVTMSRTPRLLRELYETLCVL